MSKELLFKYVLALGDDALILGQRLSQWAYKGPFLEEDIALSNISLDMFGKFPFITFKSQIVCSDIVTL